MAAPKSPTSLNTSRNIALAKGTDRSKFANPEMRGMEDQPGDDSAPLARPSVSTSGPKPL